MNDNENILSVFVDESGDSGEYNIKKNNFQTSFT